MAITAAERTQIIELTSLMFNAAPGAFYLSQIVAVYESNGRSLQTLANILGSTPIYQSLNPNFQTAAEFAADLLTPLGLQNDTFATSFIVSRFNAGQSKASIVFQAFTALNGVTATDAAQYQAAKTALLNKTAVAEYYSVTKEGAATDLITLQSVVGGVTDVAATVDAAKAAVDALVITGQTFTLTTGIDTIVGTAGNDIIVAVLDDATPANATFTNLDSIDGGAGNADTLQLNDLDPLGSDFPAGVTLKNVEIAVVRGAGVVDVNTSAAQGLTKLQVTQATDATVVAAATTAVEVTGAGGTISVDGGASVTVSTAGADKNVTIGNTTRTAGAISVTDTALGSGDIAVDGGSNVTVAVTGSTAGSSVIVGAAKAATGTVAITSAHKAVAGVDASLATIAVTGGTGINVAQTAVSGLAAADTTGSTVTQGSVTIVGNGTTAAVVVSQTASTAEKLAATAVAGSAETASVKFGALKAGDKVTLDADASGTAGATELTFTAAKDLTAAQVATAFANLINLDTQGNAPAGNGAFTGAASLWTSAAANGDAVVFTSTKAPASSGTNVTDLAFVLTNTSGSSVAPVVTTTAGVDKVTAQTGVLGVIDGTVLIDDNATASITTVSVDGYGAGSKIGNTGTLSKLANLTLANSGGATAGATNADMTVDAVGVASLNVTVNSIKGAVSLDGAADAALKTLNLTATGADSTFALTAAAVETLAVSGDKAASLTVDLTAVKTVTASGTAGLTLSGLEANTLTSVNTSATTGKVTATIDGGKATYTGGAGVDVVTLATSTALTKTIDLGAGDDSLSFDTLVVTGSTATLSGGAGTDTLSMSTAAADALDGAVQSFYTGFERLTLNTAYGDNDGVLDTLTLNLSNLGFTSFVTTAGTLADTVVANSDVLVLDKLVSGGTVVLTANGLIQVNVDNAATGTADVLNAVLSSTADLAAGKLTAANVETINISTVDTETGASPTKNVDSLTLTAGAATSVNLSGSADLTLLLTGSTKVTSINGSAMTGGLTVASLNTTSATTITGGSGKDVLTAATGTTADVLNGGAGDDTLTGNAGLSTLTGGAGNDLFVVNVASLNVNSYTSITDFGAGDLIKFTGADSFQAAKITLGDTAVFQDFANAAINTVGANDVAWFQFGGNTYIVMDAGLDTTTFTEGQDFIVRLTGLVDLTGASFNVTSSTVGL
jgi:S-layer protein